MSAAFAHEGLLYSSEDEYVDALTPVVREGIAQRDAVIVSTNQSNKELLAKSSGPSASSIIFMDAADVYANVQTAIRSYHDMLRRLREQGYGSVRAIAEPEYGTSESDHDIWLRYEPLTHRVFEKSPVRFICPYDLRATPSKILDHVQRTHPLLFDREGRRENTLFIQPEELLPTLPLAFSFDFDRTADLEIETAPSDVSAVRHEIARVLRTIFNNDRTDDAMLAIGEVLANGVRHGETSCRASLWIEADAVVCAIRNEGPPIVDACAGYRPPETAAQRGVGLWLARRLSDEMEIRNNADGPTVSLAFFRDPR